MNDIPERLTAAADHFTKSFLPQFAKRDDIAAETIVAATARMAGTMLFRSFAPPAQSIEAGTIVLSDEANVKGPKLMSLMLATLQALGHALTEHDLKSEEATTAGSQLDLRETRQLLDLSVLAHCEATDLALEDAAYALAISTALFIHDCRAMLDVRKGAAIAVFGFVEGCKTAPVAVSKVATHLALVPDAALPHVAAASGAHGLAPAVDGKAARLGKYVLQFAGWYTGGLIAVAIAIHAFDITAKGFNTGLFVGAVVAVGIKFAKDQGRLWLPGEKRKLIFGILLVTLLIDTALAWLTAPAVPLLFIVGAAAFVGFLRLFGLALFFGPMAQSMFGRFATARR